MYPPARTIQYGSMGVLNENTVLVLADTDEWIRIPKLRFRPGSRVECKIRDSSAANGGFHPGTVVGTFYREDHWRPGLCAPAHKESGNSRIRGRQLSRGPAGANL